jgi:hypothetical protein
MMKKIFCLAALTGFFSQIACATEGMWIPSVLSAVYDDMKAAGLQLSEEDLYSVNNSSLKDAIVLFNGGCTGEIVSDNGLLFTNHHCGFDYIQFHSSLQNDYLKNGFWAMNRDQELICDGLSVVFIVRMDDVTAQMREGIKSGMTMIEAEVVLTKNKAALEAAYLKDNPGLGVQIRAFNYGNQYFASLTKAYNDVRLVGAPPSEIGKFGGDTDNWVWPRHTGDFSVFRIYADKNNEPARYSKDNVPFKPAHFLPVNISGVKEGEYSMVYGFPGRTDHLLTSYAVDFVMNESNPMRIDFRDQSIAVLEGAMRSSDELRIKYAAKQSDIANAWKKWKGQQIGLTNFDAIGMKQKFEYEYSSKCKLEENSAYAGLLDALKKKYDEANPTIFSMQRFVEYAYYGPELISFSNRFRVLADNYEKLKNDGTLAATIKDLKEGARLFYKDFDLTTEKAIYARLWPLFHVKYNSSLSTDMLKASFILSSEEVNKVYDKSVFRDSTVLFKLLDNFGKSSLKKLKKDPLMIESSALYDDFNQNLRTKSAHFQKEIDFLMQKYVEGMMKMFPGDYWSDANSTLRITFGQVSGSAPRDGEMYKYYTTTDGILQKNATGNPDFEIQPKLKSLLEKKEFGKYGTNGELRVCYTGSNHTTGGNSGSPALNAKGELTGINFDRSWESTMSDITYNPQICRNIMLDARYVLWVIDVYAGAGYLIDEMNVIR